MSLRRIIILGTGTDVGKTYVTTRLAELYRQEGGQCLALKPIESGLGEDAGSAYGDAARLQEAASAGARPLYAFRDPISPHLAARREGKLIDLERIVAHIGEQEENLVSSSRSVETWIPPQVDLDEMSPLAATRLPSMNPPPSSGVPGTHSTAPPSSGAPSLAPPPSSSNPNGSGPSSSRGISGGPLPAITLIETAGGAFSPVSQTKTNWDVAQALRPSALVLVAPDSLGVLHDVQATLRALSPHAPDLLVLSEARAPDSSTGTNFDEIEQVVLPQLRLNIPCLLVKRDEPLAYSALRLLAGR